MDAGQPDPIELEIDGPHRPEEASPASVQSLVTRCTCIVRGLLQSYVHDRKPWKVAPVIRRPAKPWSSKLSNLTNDREIYVPLFHVPTVRSTPFWCWGSVSGLLSTKASDVVPVAPLGSMRIGNTRAGSMIQAGSAVTFSAGVPLTVVTWYSTPPVVVISPVSRLNLESLIHPAGIRTTVLPAVLSRPMEPSSCACGVRPCRSSGNVQVVVASRDLRINVSLIAPPDASSSISVCGRMSR